MLAINSLAIGLLFPLSTMVNSALQLQLLGRLQRDAPYAGAAARFRDGGGIMEIVFIRLHVRLHELRGQQAHLMAGLRKDPAPVL